MAEVRKTIVETLAELAAKPTEELLTERLEKFRFAGRIEGRFPTVPGA